MKTKVISWLVLGLLLGVLVAPVFTDAQARKARLRPYSANPVRP